MCKLIEMGEMNGKRSDLVARVVRNFLRPFPMSTNVTGDRQYFKIYFKVKHQILLNIY